MLIIGNFLAKGYDLWVVANIHDNDIDFWLKFYDSNPLAYISYIHDLFQDGELFGFFDEAYSYAFNYSLKNNDQVKSYDFRNIAATNRMIDYIKLYS